MKKKIFLLYFLALFLLALAFECFSQTPNSPSAFSLDKIKDTFKKIPQKIAQATLNFLKLVWEKRGEILETLKTGVKMSWEILKVVYGKLWEWTKNVFEFLKDKI